MDFIAGDDVTVQLPFLVDGEYVVPDANSVSYTVRGNDGAVAVASTPISTTADQTSASVTVPGSANAINGDIEKRTVDFNWLKDGQKYRDFVSYRLTAWLNHTVKPSDVRGYIGVNADELPDQDIDLTAAYFEVADKVTKDTLDAQLALADVKALRANRAIMLFAVMRVVPGLQLKAAKSEQADTNTFSRSSRVDFDGIFQAASLEFGDIIRGFTGADETTPTQISLSTNTDPVTGV